WDTEKGAPLKLFGWPDQEEEKTKYAVEIPKLSSLILTHDPNGEVKGLKDWPKDERPPVAWVFWSFRINSQILPLKTHPEIGYHIEDLPFHDQIIQTFKDCGRFCQKHDIRTTFHPDQFILLSSPSSEVVQRSIADLIYQAEVAQWVNADVINNHGGGAYGDKRTSLRRLRKQIEQLPEAVRSLLTFENDDRVYTPNDLLPVCRDMDIPLVYDVHHHRCLSDGSSVEATTELAVGTWSREPLFHLSSPKYGWNSGKPGNHHDYIDADDFPACWTNLDITVEVEAKAKELAVLKLKQDLIDRAKRIN
ncbi:MAG TPA: UV DNA damage repair endonuclease UvsE, partial [Desulfobacterales bacterium]|nr:UV DNA damage repair endonuclease UvsE [Desulfobacterales bacterium]